MDNQVLGDRVFDVEVHQWDLNQVFYIVPTTRTVGGPIVVHYPDGQGGWTVKEFDPFEPISDFKPLLQFPERWARALYEKLREFFDPQDTVSVDAIKMQGQHLEDMRTILFHNMGIKAGLK